MSKPTLLIATPAYGGMFTQQYLESMLNTWDWIGAEGIQVATYFISNESLITRARNTCATLCLEKGIDKLLFIDADIGWTPEDVSRLYYSDKKIIGGLYPHKKYPIQLNWNPRSDYSQPNAAGEVKVHSIATGFLMIDRAVLENMARVVETYESTHMNGVNRKYYDFFTLGTRNGAYLSEDWSFCVRATDMDYDIWANVNTVLTHTGTNTWRAGE